MSEESKEQRSLTQNLEGVSELETTKGRESETLIPAILSRFGEAQIEFFRKGDSFFVSATSIARALGYTHAKSWASKITKRMREDPTMQNHVGVAKLATPQGIQELNVLDPVGAMHFIRFSQKPLANKIMEFVFSEFLRLAQKEINEKLKEKELQLTFLEGEKEQLLLETQILAKRPIEAISSREEKNATYSSFCFENNFALFLTSSSNPRFKRILKTSESCSTPNHFLRASNFSWSSLFSAILMNFLSIMFAWSWCVKNVLPLLTLDWT